jgi:glutamate-1-semialdehyde aminotransferase
MPLSVLAGRAEIMRFADEQVFFFTTFGGEALSLAAAKATIGELRRRDVPAHLAAIGNHLQRGIERIRTELGLAWPQCEGLPARTQLAWRGAPGDPLLLKSFVQQELIKRGVLWSGFHALSYSHKLEDIEYLLSAYRDVLPALAHAVVRDEVRSALRGAPVQPVFRSPPPKPAAARDASLSLARDA